MSQALDGLTPERRAVVRVICSADAPVGAKEIAKGVSSSEASIRQMLTPLVEAGLISKVSRGRYWRPGAHKEPDVSQQGTVLQSKGTVLQSNAEPIVMGAETVWVPLFPVSLGAGPEGDTAIEVEPEGAVPIPASFARALGIVNGHVPFAVYVRGDSMRGELEDESVALGYRTEVWEGEGIYAVYLSGELLVKRVQRVRGGYELVSTNPAYAPLPVETDEVRIIGRVKGALTRL